MLRHWTEPFQVLDYVGTFGLRPPGRNVYAVRRISDGRRMYLYGQKHTLAIGSIVNLKQWGMVKDADN